MRTFLKIYIALIIVIVLGLSAQALYWKYKLAYGEGLLDGMCYMTNRFDLDTEGACNGRSEEPDVHYSYKDK